jgi:transposase
MRSVPDPGASPSPKIGPYRRPCRAKPVCISVVNRDGTTLEGRIVDVVGIDVGKKDLHAVLLQGEKSSLKSASNSATGIAQLIQWLKNRKVERAHVCMEATGGWSESVALALHQSGHVVSIVNPSRIKAFAQSEMLRTKTDAVDAAMIARFCRMHAPDPWLPPAPEIVALRGLVRRHESLSRMRAEEQTRLQAPTGTPTVRESIESVISHLTSEIQRVDREIEQLFKNHPGLREQRRLLTSIPGIGKTTAARILGEAPNIAEYRDVKAIAAFAGLSPRHYQSGSLRRPSRLAKAGNAQLRRALYWPAITAMRCNPIVARFADRLRQRDKTNMLIIGAAMRKLLVLAYGVLKSGKNFDPAYVGS